MILFTLMFDKRSIRMFMHGDVTFACNFRGLDCGAC